MTNIGFIGVGNMGGPMLANLLKAGHGVKAFDLAPAALAKAVAAGASATKIATDAARDVDAVITMLPAGRHVREVYLGDKGLIAAARRSTIMIDSSTIDVATAREVVNAADAAGMLMVDAPVSGGVGGATAATLTFMVGGGAKAFAAAKPILDCMGKTIVHAGLAGMGQAAKICNNMVLGVSMIAVCEAFVLAEKLGLDKQKLFDISSKSSGQCWSMTTYCPVPGPVPTSPANRDYQGGFAADLMLKDLRLSQEAAKSAGVSTPLGSEATALYAEFAQGGQGGLDFSGIITMIRAFGDK